MIATTVSLNGETVRLHERDLALVRESTKVRLLDLNDGLGVDLQAFVPRLGGWTNIATFKR